MQHIGRLIKTVNDRMKKRADANLKAHNLTLSQGRVLGFLSRCGGTATQKEIEQFLDISHPTVVGIISRMERNGYLTCTTDKKDRRNKIVNWTPQAELLDHEILQQIKQNEARMLEKLSEDEIKQLCRILTIICDNLE